jgi:hypothetical protein
MSSQVRLANLEIVFDAFLRMQELGYPLLCTGEAPVDGQTSCFITLDSGSESDYVVNNKPLVITFHSPHPKTTKWIVQTMLTNLSILGIPELFENFENYRGPKLSCYATRDVSETVVTIN